MAEDYYPHFTGEEDGMQGGHLMCLGDRWDLNPALQAKILALRLPVSRLSATPQAQWLLGKWYSPGPALSLPACHNPHQAEA